MDETVKPVRIPPEMSIYAEKHDIFDLVQVTKCFNCGFTSPDILHHFVVENIHNINVQSEPVLNLSAGLFC